MKTLKSKITEALTEKGNDILRFIKACASCCSGYQKALFQQKEKDADSVQCVPLSEVFTPEEIKKIKKQVKPKQKECYANSFHLATSGIGKDVKYVEGYLWLYGFAIEHAWNKVGDKYVDITVELALKNDVREEEYVVLGEYSANDALRIMAKKGTYGGVYDADFLSTYKEPVEKTA